MHSRHEVAKGRAPGALACRSRWRAWGIPVAAAVLLTPLFSPAHAIEGPGRFDDADPNAEIVQPPDSPGFREFRRTLADASPQAIPHSPAGDLLQAWILAHNQKSAEALHHWLRTSLNPAISDDDVRKRLDWYVEATEVFGPLSQEPLAVVENEPHRLLVHLVRSDMGPLERFNPVNIVVVELDVDVDDPQYLARGLGLASLACETRKDEEQPPRKR